MRTCTITRPTLGGPGLPISVERAMQKPHAVRIPNHIATLLVPHSENIHIHKASTIAAFLTEIENFPGFQVSRKSVSKRFLIMFTPTHITHIGLLRAICIAKIY